MRQEVNRNTSDFISHQFQNTFERIWLNIIIESQHVASHGPACLTAMNHLVPLLAVLGHLNRFHDTSTPSPTVAWKHVEVNGVQTIGAMISTRLAGRFDLAAAIRASKPLVNDRELSGIIQNMSTP